MAEQEQEQKTSPNRQKVINDFVEHLNADGTPAQVVEAYTIAGDACYCAYRAGLMAARRMELEGDIMPDQVLEIAMEFAKIIAMKITITPQPSQLMTPQIGGGGGAQHGILPSPRRG